MSRGANSVKGTTPLSVGKLDACGGMSVAATRPPDSHPGRAGLHAGGVILVVVDVDESIDRFKAKGHGLNVLLAYDRAAQAEEIAARLDAIEARLEAAGR